MTVEIAQKRLSNDYGNDFLEVKGLWQKILRASDYAL